MTLLLHAATIALAAFLLFGVQPMMGKFLLPRFGGGAGVWAACLAFFQLGLFAGYWIAHRAIRLSARSQAIAFGIAALVAGLSLALSPGELTSMDGGSSLVGRVVADLSLRIGLPFVLLASTAPLVQHWAGRMRPTRSPYPLYAISNAASLSALLIYPFWVEPALTRSEQFSWWTAGFAGFTLLGVGCVLTHWKSETRLAAFVPGQAQRRSAIEIVLWILLPACGAALLVATTNRLTQFVAPVPFLWVLPLAVYLLSYVISFHHPRGYRRGLFAPALIVLVLALIWVEGRGAGVEDFSAAAKSFWVETALVCAILFSACMLCHGELHRLAPEPESLTSFYLAVAGGGALGGLSIALLAPLVLDSNPDLQLALLAAGLLWLGCVARERISPLLGFVALIWIASAVLFGVQQTRPDAEVVVMRRNAYGTLTLFERERDEPRRQRLQLYSGSTLHGEQYLHPELRPYPTTYFTQGSGVGRALRSLPLDRPLSLGVIGLGIGTLAAYGNEGDRIRFYELDPAVVQMAQQSFHYLEDCRARVELVLGDARLSLQGEEGQSFDVLVLDAFQNDAIPLHLLTVESFEQYLRHLTEDGILAVHVSSRYVDLVPPLAALARHFGLDGASLYHDDGVDKIALSATWVLLSRGSALINELLSSGLASALPADGRVPWTDDHASVIEAMSF